MFLFELVRNNQTFWYKICALMAVSLLSAQITEWNGVIAKLKLFGLRIGLVLYFRKENALRFRNWHTYLAK